MSLLCAASDVRITLGDLKNAFQLQVSPSYSDDVTLTSLSDSLQSVTTGSLYMPSFEECGKANVCDIVGSAEKRGAYAALLPASLKEEETSQSFGIPVLFGDLDIDKIGSLIAGFAGHPADSMAVFAVCGSGATEAVMRIASLLHVLGNPTGVISASKSCSIDRDLNLSFPLTIADVYQTLSVLSEDGLSSVVICMDDETLTHTALTGVGIDVVGLTGEIPDYLCASECCDSSERIDSAQRSDSALSAPEQSSAFESAGTPRSDTDLERTQPINTDSNEAELNYMHVKWASDVLKKYGNGFSEITHVARADKDDAALVRSVGESAKEEDLKALAAAVAMAAAAGVRRNGIRDALRMSLKLDR